MKSKKKSKKNSSGTIQQNNGVYKKQMLLFLAAVILWLVTDVVLHLPGIKDAVARFFIRFTLNSAVIFGKMLFLPVESTAFPFITVDGYIMQIVMECTAYNFYVFVFYLSLFSPVSWKEKIKTLIIFLLAVFIINNLRFITVGYIGKYSENMFHLVHDYLWNILFGFLVFIIWAWRYNVNKQ